jgi:hypothetical protein
MTRWILALVAALCGAAWWITDGAPDEALGDDVGLVGGGEVVALSRPEPNDPPAEVDESEDGAAEDVELPVEPEPVAPPESRRPDLETLVDRARGLVAAGRTDEARKLATQALGAARSEREAGRMALVLAELESDPATQRRLLGRALRTHAVRGDEWETVGAALRTLAANPRGSLHGLIATEAYSVRPGDSLWKICNHTLPREHGLTVETGLIRLVNGLSSDTVHPGQTLLVPKLPLTLEIDRKEHGLVAWLGEVPMAAYRIGLGKENRTPSGTFVIEDRQENPDWYHQGRRIPFGDPENVLGTRWLGFEDVPMLSGYGIHGTAHPESVGGDESMGCVRMRNEEVEELFELVPRGTQVSIP